MTVAPSAPPRRLWYYGWNIVAVMILSQIAANGLTYNAFSLFLPAWSGQLHAQISLLQLAVFLMVVLGAFMSPIAGGLIDRYSARPIFAIGLLGVALFYFGMSFVTAPWQILALYALIAPWALVLSTAVPANALISRWFVRHIGLALGLSAFGIGMGGVILPPLIAWALPLVGWRAIWQIGAAILVLVVTPLVVVTLRNRPSEREGLDYMTGAGSAARPHGHGHAAAGQGGLGWREVLSRRNFWLLVGIYLPMLALYGGCGQNLAPYVASHGLKPTTAGLLLSVLSFSHIIATLALGLVSDRFGNRLPFFGLAVIMIAGAVLLAFGPGLPAIALACALIGFGGGLYPLLASAMAAEFGADNFGRAYGLSMLFLPVMALAPFMVAKIRETTGSYTSAFLIIAGVVAISGVLSLLLRERRGGHLTEAEKDAVLEQAVSPAE